MKNILLGSTAFAMVLAVAASPRAMAQTAASATAAPPQVQEVVITAQKRSERLSTVAVTADVVSAANLTAMGVTDISDLNKLVPAVSLNATTNGRVPYAMRGVSTTANEGNVGLESGVGIEVDGIPIPSDSHAAQQMEDLENVQILEGPQATLGGRTAAAGLIDMVTRGPKNHWTGQASATFTTDGEKRGDIYIAGPITPGWDFSLSGYGNQTPYPVHNLYDNHYTTQGATGMRGKLQYKPDALLTATLTAHVAEALSYGSNFVYNYFTPGSYLLTVPEPFLASGALMPGVTPSNNNYSINSIAQNTGSRIFDRDASLNVSYQLGNLTLGSITAYQSESEKDVQDLFIVDQYFFNKLTDGYLNFDNNQVIRNHLNQFSQEFKLTSPAEDQFNYVVGLFGSTTDITSLTERNGLPPATEDILAHPDTNTYDAYARATYKLTPQFAITAGFRFNDDQLRYSQTQYAFAPFASNLYSSGHTNSGALVGDVDVKYNFDPNNMLYATYARGYAPQAYNTASPLGYSPAITNTGSNLVTAPSLSPVARMDINHFEIGSKGRYLDGQLVLDGDIFYTIYDNYQIETFSGIPGLTNPPLVLASAPEAQTHGVEANGTYRPTANTTLNLSAAYIDATFVKDKDGECWFNGGSTAGTSCYSNPNGSPSQDVSGKPLPNSPKFKAVANGQQVIPWDAESANVVLGATYTWRSSAQMLPDQSPYAVQRAFGLLDLTAGLETQDGKYNATIFVNNVANQVYYTDVEDFFNSVWGVPGGRNETVMGQPGRDARRFEGLRLTAKF